MADKKKRELDVRDVFLNPGEFKVAPTATGPQPTGPEYNEAFESFGRSASDYAPLAGGIAGEVVGSVFPPVAPLTAGAGAALGEGVRQWAHGQPTNWNDIAWEGGINAMLAGLPVAAKYASPYVKAGLGRTGALIDRIFARGGEQVAENLTEADIRRIIREEMAGRGGKKAAKAAEATVEKGPGLLGAGPGERAAKAKPVAKTPYAGAKGEKTFVGATPKGPVVRGNVVEGIPSRPQLGPASPVTQMPGNIQRVLTGEVAPGQLATRGETGLTTTGRDIVGTGERSITESGIGEVSPTYTVNVPGGEGGAGGIGGGSQRLIGEAPVEGIPLGFTPEAAGSAGSAGSAAPTAADSSGFSVQNFLDQLYRNKWQQNAAALLMGLRSAQENTARVSASESMANPPVMPTR